MDEPPGAGNKAGGITVYESDSDKSTFDPRTIAGGLATMFEFPTGGNFGHEYFDVHGLAEHITEVKAVHLNPCTTAGSNGACSSVDQTQAGLDDLMDFVILSTT